MRATILPPLTKKEQLEVSKIYSVCGLLADSRTLLQELLMESVQVEVDISMGMPVFDMVGYLSPEVREAKERVRTALHNCGILLPAKRITVNLSPANIRKTGTGFDLPIAVALLVAMGLVKPEKCADTIFSGELNLSGQLLRVRGILPMVSDGVKEGIHKFVVPADNLMESRLVQGADVCGFSALESVIGYLQDVGYKEPAYAGQRQNRSHGMPDFSEVNGQQFLKRAAEIAASGMHNMLMVRRNRCRCTQASLQRYFDRISQPLIDRMDLCVEAPMVTYEELTGNGNNESSKTIRDRVCECQERQIFRFKDEIFSHNSGIPAAKLNQFCRLGEKEQRYMEKMFHKLSLTARTYHKILRVARTIADTQKAENIRVCDLTEAVCYRSIGDKFWGGMEE